MPRIPRPIRWTAQRCHRVTVGRVVLARDDIALRIRFHQRRTLRVGVNVGHRVRLRMGFQPQPQSHAEQEQSLDDEPTDIHGVFLPDRHDRPSCT